MSDRRSPNLETKLASALLMLGDVPFEHAQMMTADQICSLYQFDHGRRHAEDGPLVFWNLTPRLIAAHRQKSAKIDAPEMARNRDIRTTHAIHQAAMASKAGDYAGAAEILANVPKPSRLKPKRKIPSRPFPKGYRPMQSRGFR